MQKLFNKILVPIDFSSRSKTAIEKAVDIAMQYDCSIHLLHIVTISPFAAVVIADGHIAVPFSIIDNKRELEFHLKKYCDYINLLTEDSVKADYSILIGTWDETIIDFVNQNKFDLVLIGQKGRTIRKRKMLLNPDKIAAKTNIPVITIPSNRRITKLLSIVIPITEFLPVRKLIYGIYLSSNYNTTIKLLGIKNDRTKDKVQRYLLRSYRLIRDNYDIKVELKTVFSNNVAEAVNEFARLQSADLVIVNPETQTKMPGFLSSLRGKILQKYSSPPVLTLNPV